MRDQMCDLIYYALVAKLWLYVLYTGAIKKYNPLKIFSVSPAIAGNLKVKFYERI